MVQELGHEADGAQPRASGRFRFRSRFSGHVEGSAFRALMELGFNNCLEAAWEVLKCLDIVDLRKLRCSSLGGRVLSFTIFHP